ncbi:MAG: rod shape-determining protein, partial [Vulcanimicrobiaceae bacterium]
DITETRAQMVVDIGGGTTEIAIIGISGVIRLRSVQIGGDHLDEAIIQRLAAERFLIGRQTAEHLKIALGYIGRPPGNRPLVVSGTDLAAGAPRKRAISEEFVAEAIAPHLRRIARAICGVIETVPPEVAGDLVETGLVLTGGGSLVTGFAGEMHAQTNVPTTVASEPLLCVARGAGAILASATLLERLRPSTDRLTRWYQSLRIGMRESYSP